MIEIALCDDNGEDILAVKDMTAQLASEHENFPLRLTAFTSAKELLEQREKDFDLYILDVLMPDMTGIRLAEMIRSRGEHSEIIFLTSSRDYALDAFSVYASGYLLKPVSKDNFDETLFRLIQKIAGEKNEVLAVKTKDGIRRIPLYKIVMIESFNHVREITMSDNSVLETNATLSELFDRLKENMNFFMPHRAYIANLDNTVGITRYNLMMLGNRSIPIPKSQYAAVQNTVRDYFFKRKD
ncbi:MAG: LytTR family DNA-binding domain-containing protein [Firmicutes bacterium]|nr:LytTR family DNA-binding domain-containing protein [[Eubacterium] siraeum]MCM1487073.1 LytTR family DNA-binding domain-containing protein [Bacillota bacterium]